MGKHFIDPKRSEILSVFQVFPCTTQIALFWPKLLPALFFKKTWYPCPFEILAEALDFTSIYFHGMEITKGSWVQISKWLCARYPTLFASIQSGVWMGTSLHCLARAIAQRSNEMIFSVWVRRYTSQSKIEWYVQAFQLHVFHTVIRCKEYRMSLN
jgi:hypothetical protein